MDEPPENEHERLTLFDIVIAVAAIAVTFVGVWAVCGGVR